MFWAKADAAPDFERPDLARLYANSRWLRLLVMCIFQSLSLFEYPAWCYKYAIQDTPPNDWMIENLNSTEFEPCGSQDIVFMSRGYGSRLPVPVTQGIETFCILFMLGEQLLYSRAIGFHKWKTNRWSLAIVLLLLLFWLDVTVAYFNQSGFLLLDKIRFSAMLRSVLICLRYASTRKLLLSALRIAWQLRDLFVILVFVLCWFGLACHILFIDQRNDDNWKSFGESVKQIFILFTTANNPDVFMKEYNNHRESMILGVIIVIIGVFFIINFILVSVVEAHDDDLETNPDQDPGRKSLENAFLVLDVGAKNRVSVESLRLLFVAMKKYRRIANISSKEETIFFNTLDTPDSGSVDRDQFYRFFENVRKNLKNRRHERWNVIKPFCGHAYGTPERVERFQKYFRSWVYHLLFNTVLIANAITIWWQVDAQNDLLQKGGPDVLSGDNPRNIDPTVEFLFTIFFCIEQLVQLCCLGSWLWWSKRFNRVLAMFASISFCLELVIIASPGSTIKTSLLTGVQLCRMILLCRVLSQFKRFRLIVKTTVSVLPNFGKLCATLATFMAFYTHIGGFLFGGLVFKDNPLMAHTTFSKANYWSMNFNDFGAGMNVLFNVLVVNNWFIIMDGYIAATDTGCGNNCAKASDSCAIPCGANTTCSSLCQTAAATCYASCPGNDSIVIYFVFFYLFGVLIFANIFVSNIFASYADQKAKILAIREQNQPISAHEKRSEALRIEEQEYSVLEKRTQPGSRLRNSLSKVGEDSQETSSNYRHQPQNSIGGECDSSSLSAAAMSQTGVSPL